MRAVITLLLLALALWRAAVDWQATIGQGYAYRFGTPGTLLGGRWPEQYGRLVEGLQRTGLSWTWDPVGALVLSLPVSLVLATLAAAVWITRERASSRRSWR